MPDLAYGMGFYLSQITVNPSKVLFSALIKPELGTTRFACHFGGTDIIYMVEQPSLLLAYFVQAWDLQV